MNKACGTNIPRSPFSWYLNLLASSNFPKADVSCPTSLSWLTTEVQYLIFWTPVLCSVLSSNFPLFAYFFYWFTCLQIISGSIRCLSCALCQYFRTIFYFSGLCRPIASILLLNTHDSLSYINNGIAVNLQNDVNLRHILPKLTYT